MRAILIGFTLILLSGCATIDEALLDKCIAAAKEQVQFCTIEQDDAACNAAKVALATCRKDASNQLNEEFWNRIAEWIREAIIGGILTTTAGADERYSRAHDLLDFIDQLKNEQAVGAAR